MGRKAVRVADINSAEGEAMVAQRRLTELQTLRWKCGRKAETEALDKWDNENGEILRSTVVAVRAAEERLRNLRVTRSQVVNRSRTGEQVVEWAAIAFTFPNVYKPTGRRGVIEVSDGLPVNGKRMCRYDPGDLVVRLLRKDWSLSNVVVRLDSSWLDAGVQHKRTASKVVRFSDYEPVTVKKEAAKHGKKTANAR